MNKEILEEINAHKNISKAKILANFFKTGKGEYGEGDKFLGLTVPVCRNIAKKYSNLELKKVSILLKNKFHEIRLIGILILVLKYKNNTAKEREEIVNFYLKNTKYINNWDLVDLSCHYILGDYLLTQKNKNILLKLAHSKNLWEQRIAIVSTFAFIYKGEKEWTFKIVKMYLRHEHDLIHKASGWMLREVGKRVSEKELKKFLDTYYNKMPRTMLRYAIERFPEKIRKSYLQR